MAETTKRGPGRPKTPPEVRVGDIVQVDPESGDYVKVGGIVNVEPKTEDWVEIDIPSVSTYPEIERKLIQTSHSTLLWVHPDWDQGYAATIAYGWSDGLVTWGETRG